MLSLLIRGIIEEWQHYTVSRSAKCDKYIMCTGKPCKPTICDASRERQFDLSWKNRFLRWKLHIIGYTNLYIHDLYILVPGANDLPTTTPYGKKQTNKKTLHKYIDKLTQCTQLLHKGTVF